MRCTETNPTLKAKRHFTQLTIGACTQYATQIAGMPTEIVKEFNKIQCTFMWNGAVLSQLGKETLQMDLHMGGKRMFNL